MSEPRPMTSERAVVRIEPIDDLGQAGPAISTIEAILSEDVEMSSLIRKSVPEHELFCSATVLLVSALKLLAEAGRERPLRTSTVCRDLAGSFADGMPPRDLLLEIAEQLDAAPRRSYMLFTLRTWDVPAALCTALLKEIAHVEKRDVADLLARLRRDVLRGVA